MAASPPPSAASIRDETEDDACRSSPIGGALVRAGVGRCRDLGAQGVVVMGHPQYYPRFGFVPAARFGLDCEYDTPPEAFMALELAPGALRAAAGTVRYHAAFAGA